MSNAGHHTITPVESQQEGDYFAQKFSFAYLLMLEAQKGNINQKYWNTEAAKFCCLNIFKQMTFVRQFDCESH